MTLLVSHILSLLNLMYSLIIFLPLLATLWVFLGGRWWGEEGSSFITIGHMIGAWLLSILLIWEIWVHQSLLLVEGGTWLPLWATPLHWGLLFDPLTACMSGVVCTVSSLVHLYSYNYMAGDPHRPRFMAYLSFFTFFMLLLVFSDNLLQMFVGWEGVGLCSYLLIGFWYTRLEANKSAIKAMVVNRVGDLGLLLGILGIWYYYGTLQYLPLKILWLQHLDSPWLNWLVIGLLIGAIGKSAQLGLHTWLPDAMEGPTPVSALIHAATMVTAGVFLLIRMSSLLELSSWALLGVIWIGALTAFFAGTVGVYQQDLKKIIAYSTCSQLGYMVAACGLSWYSVALFHLTTHAFFKALLFLGAGSIIHALGDEQDIRVAGGLRHRVPLSYLLMVVGSLALVGFPFLAGYFSKDLLLELAYGCYWKQMVYGFLLAAALCTAYYSWRLARFTFNGSYRGPSLRWSSIQESTWTLWIPLIILGIGSLTIGYLSQIIMIGGNPPLWLSTAVKLTPLLFLGLAWLISWGIGQVPITQYWHWSNLKSYRFFNQAWAFNTIGNSFFTYPCLRLSYHTAYKTLDRGLLEILGPTGMYQNLVNWSQKASHWQTGYLFHYTLTLIITLCLIYSLSACTPLVLGDI